MRFFILDCFAQERYQGNELAVLVCDRDVSDREMQQIAREMNFSETAFITSGRHADGSYDARIFTPAIEVPFAGHPTLGLAHIVHHVLEGGAGERALLNLKAGQIPVAVRGDVLTMTQNQPVFGDVVDAASVVPCFGIELSYVRDELPVQWVSTGLEAVLIPLKNLDALARCRVDHARFGTWYVRVRRQPAASWGIELRDRSNTWHCTSSRKPIAASTARNPSARRAARWARPSRW